MGGSRRQTTTTSQTQNQNTTLGSTPFAMPFLPQYQQAAQNAADMGGYTGDVVAAPTQASSYAPQLGDISGMVFDPGAPLEDYTPDVNVLDHYVAGATPTSRAGLASAQDWASTQGGQVQGTAQNLMDYWNRVSSGYYLDPQQNDALQGYLDNMSEGSMDAFQKNAQNFKSQAIDSGAYGGTGYGRGMAWGLDEFTQDDMAQRSAVLYQNYLDEMNRIGQADEGMVSAYGLGLVPGQTMMGLGDIERGYNQLDINDQIARGSEQERAQAYDIQDAAQRRQDIALRGQAGLDNERGMAQWDAAQQQGRIQDEIMRNQVDQQIRQAGLTNDQSQWDANRYGAMDAWERYFGGLSSPVFGQNSEGEMHGTSTTSQQNPWWQDALGAASAAAQIWSSFTNPAAGAMQAGTATMNSANQAGGGGGSAPYFSPMNFPTIDYGSYFANPSNQLPGSQIPQWLQNMYNMYPTPAVNPGG